jgi:hypothetical protein
MARDSGQGFNALLGGEQLPANAYRVEDADTIIVTGITGPGAWTRITNVVESGTEVRITVRSFRWPGSYTSIGEPIAWTVDLERPLGDRIVHDGLGELPREEEPD